MDAVAASSNILFGIGAGKPVYGRQIAVITL